MWPQTVALRAQLEAMRDGGVYALSIPKVPYRCPPGPYERACQVAWYFKNAKPRSKVLVLDANQDVTSKGALFKKVWAEQYPGMVEFRGQHKATAVDARTNTVKFEVQDDVKADVLNVVPKQRAGELCALAGARNDSAGYWIQGPWVDYNPSNGGVITTSSYTDAPVGTTVCKAGITTCSGTYTGSGTTTQITKNRDWDIRWPSSDNRDRIVYERDGELEKAAEFWNRVAREYPGDERAGRAALDGDHVRAAAREHRHDDEGEHNRLAGGGPQEHPAHQAAKPDSQP